MLNMEKYYIPKEEELHIGYICEYRCVKIFGVGIKEYHDWKPITIDWGWLTYDEEIQFRTKYLDSEDIEKEGWINNGQDKFYVDCMNFQFNTIDENSSYLNYFMKVDFNSHWIQIEEMGSDSLYQGECKSINEFRKICKWLNIK